MQIRSVMINKSILVLIASLALLFLFQSELPAQNASRDSLHLKADSLYENYEETEALRAYENILEEEPENYKALWRASFLYSRIGNRKDDNEQQQEYFNKAISLAEKALQEDSTDVHSNFAMSVAMGRKALIASTRERVAASRDIKKYVDRALAQDSTHAGSWHVLGRWHFKVANLNFVERLAANTLFGGIPGDASNDKAVRAIKRAVDLKDKYVLYHHDLAMVYDEMGEREKAIEACQMALKQETLTPDDPKLKEECRNWIKDWES